MSKTKNANPSKITIFKNEIYGIIILAFSFLLSYSLYFKSSGIAERYLKNFSMGLLGIGAFIVPVIIFLIGIGIIITKGKLQVKQRFIALCLLIFNILLIIQIKNSYLYKDYSFLFRINKVFKDGLAAKGCGVLSEIFNIPLIYFFSKTGSYIILICVCIIFALISTEASIQSFLSSIYKNKKVKNKKVKPAQTDALSNPKLCNENELALDKTAYKQNIDKMDKKIQILDFLKSDNEKQINNEDKPENNTSSSEKENNIPSEDTFNKIKLNKEANGNHLEYIFPQVELLNPGKTKSNMHDKKELLNNAKTLENTLESFGVEAKVIQVSRGPSVTRYELQPNPGVKVSRIVNLADDIALNLAAPSVRIEAPIPGKAAVGIELPNKEVMPVTLREVIESNEFKDFKSNLAFSLGKNISGKCVVADLSKMPHLLIAGATGSGKSVCINTLIVGLLYKSSPDDVKVLLIDPKVVELSVYNGIPHLLIPVVTDPKKAASALYWAVNEMNERYKLFADNNVRNIESYNELMLNESPEKKLPQIVIIIDELADLMMAAPNDVEDTICRLAQMARAAGMHLVIATQRPSVDVITGVIKANIPSRISFAVSSQIDSRTILDMSGAEKLLGRGDMLFLPIGESKPVRIQGAFISEKEVENIVEFLKNSTMAKYNDSIIEEIESKSSKAETTSEDDDELLPEAIKISVELGQISASMLQRKLRVGFNRASRLIEEMEVRGIVSAQDGSKPRQVLVSKEEYTNNMLNI